MAIKLSKIINSWVPENSKVIDFGCGDGSLLNELFENKWGSGSTDISKKCVGGQLITFSSVLC